MVEDFSDISIKSIMTTDMVTVAEEDSIENLLELFEKHHFHTYPVVAKNCALAGIIDQDIILEILLFHRSPRTKHTHMAATRSLGINAREIMIPHPITISPDANLHDAADLMLKHRINRVCVVEDDTLVGIISKRDIINEVYKKKGVD